MEIYLTGRKEESLRRCQLGKKKSLLRDGARWKRLCLGNNLACWLSLTLYQQIDVQDTKPISIQQIIILLFGNGIEMGEMK